ncbi:MAG: DUF72 domain-containing protein [Armatimonadota bacterium]|nr:DUF72 domain-containing protein [Armatimonadota bacterium]
MSGRLYIGTSGWNYKHWIGILYPKSSPSSQWLSIYSNRFDTVEVNNSFYRLPERSVFESWARSSPDNFIFAVKASRFLTHMKKLKDPEEPLNRMVDHAEGLGKKLGPILYQLPPWWKVNADRLRAFLAILPKNLRHVFEFRDASWQTDSVFDLLREYGAGYCIMSAPDLPLHLISTAGFVYIRMHSGGAETEGCYTDDALRWWADRVADFMIDNDVYVYFNNDYKGYAVQNAETLKESFIITKARKNENTKWERVNSGQ